MQAPPTSQAKHARPKRVITEARKLQNREAQRTYRQRQKERIHIFKAGAQEKSGSTRYQELRPYPAPQDAQRDVPSINDLDSVAQAYRPQEPYAVGTSITSIVDTDSSISTSSIGTLYETQSLSSTNVPADPFGGAGSLNILFPTPAASASIDVDDLLAVSGDQEFITAPLEDIDTESPQHSFPSTSASAYTSTTYDLHSHYAFRPTASRSTFLADPHKNYLQTPKTNLIAACLHNATLIGISLEEFFSYNCMSLCSPFYRRTTSSADPHGLLCDATSSYPLLPAHLQPTLPQILIPHHPLFDLIPIPRLRSRAIILSATVPHLVDMFELKADIVEGGLLCLGTGNEVASRGNDSSQPWEVGSWQIAPWFLKKWKLLLDNHGGDLWG
ncbi:hypothetical protein BJX64DRAFT_265242 [Aspergillus heterothallicus]